MRVLATSSALACLLLCAPRAFALESMDADDAEDVLEDVDREISDMQRELRVIAQGYEEPLPGISHSRVERRLRQAEVHYLLNDYLRASIVLIDVVEDPGNESHPRYDDCVYLLAESLRQTENYAGARRYLEWLLPRSRGERLKDVVLSLLQIANATGNYDGVDNYAARLQEAGEVSRPEVDYIQGKMLLTRASNDPGRAQRAYRLFKGIAPGSRVSAPASYYAGVALVSEGEYEKAIGEFKEALTRAKSSGAVREMAHLSLGRLYFELGDISAAVDHYQEVGRNSEHFQEMLFEVAWAHVKDAASLKDEKQRNLALRRALQTADLLMATEPDARLFPEARILEGNLQIRLGADEVAYDTFQSIIDRYGGVRTRLGELVASNPDPKQFIEELVKQDLEAVSATQFVPPLALDFAVEQPEMKRTVNMIRGLQEAEKNTRESEELLKVLTEALEGEQRYEMFGGIAGARAKSFKVENRLVLVHRRLLDTERALLLGRVDAGSEARMAAVYSRRARLESQLTQLPQSEDEIEFQRSEIAKAYTDVERRVFRQSYAIASMRAQTVAVEVWMAQNKRRLGKGAVSELAERIDRAKGLIAALETDLSDLQSEIRTASAIYGGDAGRRQARLLRDEYYRAAQEEAQLHQTLLSRLPADEKAAVERIDSRRRTLEEIKGRLAELQKVLDAQIDERLAEVTEAIVTETKRLAEYRAEYVTLRQDTDQILGPVAIAALRGVAKQFEDLELKADVGIIDVAWARKQRSADEVGDLVRQQNDRIRELELEFADVLQGE